jgi:hypothetical protein
MKYKGVLIMDENEIDLMADDLFEPITHYAYNLSLDDALSLAEAMEIRFQNYAEGIRYDLRNSR